ncbi:hypothetical protein F2Q68_00025746 [Brassica cretica]|uniref:Uncharacterized protein n=1 Tax=Brassica cretica TaxID=69181 RepID=A0A8S9I8N2_BRACR|nr:hypothetical protein F2Q68_00025746 [Brassica cretica]
MTGMTKINSNGETNRYHRETQGTEKIVLSNKYGSLDTDRNPGGLRDDVSPGEENKENQDMNIRDTKARNSVKAGLLIGVELLSSNDKCISTSQIQVKQQPPSNVTDEEKQANIPVIAYRVKIHLRVMMKISTRITMSSAKHWKITFRDIIAESDKFFHGRYIDKERYVKIANKTILDVSSDVDPNGVYTQDKSYISRLETTTAHV